jgi:hypothetical protein
MGIYVGLAPKSLSDDLYSLLWEADGGPDVGVRWGVGENAYYEILRSAMTSIALHPRDGEVQLFGLPVQVDASLPAGTIELRDRHGQVVGRITNIGPSRCPLCATAKEKGVMICVCGQRLNELCVHCGDILPDGARFCITCGTVVAVDGPTRRL